MYFSRRLFSTYKTISDQVVKYQTIPDQVVKDFSNEIKLLHKFIRSKKKISVITGAGISTESGIPDYRSPKGSYSKGHKPTTFQQFISSPTLRKRYWARSYLGWEKFYNSKPNKAHISIRELEIMNYVDSIITQNVDRLHHKAGSINAIELHGSMKYVTCISCYSRFDRVEFQMSLKEMNEEWFKENIRISKDEITKSSRADGDVSIEADFESFKLPKCHKCGGDYKPDVVMFGENIHIDIVNKSYSCISKADGVLVVGSSLMVPSAYRLVKFAVQNHLPVGIINIGETKGDDIAEFKIEGLSGTILSQVVSELKKDYVEISV